MRTTFLFIRHGETDLAGTFCGSSDPGLNERGRGQAEALAARLAGERMDALVSSDLRRARETAAVLGLGRGLAVQVRAGLREIDFGAWEGMRWKEIEAGDPVYAGRWVKEFPALPAPGGEVFSGFRGRVLREVEWLRGVGQQQVPFEDDKQEQQGQEQQQVPFGDDELEKQGQGLQQRQRRNMGIPGFARNDLGVGDEAGGEGEPIGEGRCVAVVTHGGVMGFLLEEFGGCSAHEAWRRTRDYTCVIRFVQESAVGGFRLES